MTGRTPAKFDPPGLSGRSLALLLGLAALCGFLVVRHAVHDPENPLLLDGDDAIWIVRGEPVELAARGPGEFTVSFRTEFRVGEIPGETTLLVRGLRSARVFIDGEPVGPRTDPSEWKRGVLVDLAPRLSPGDHRLRIDVTHEDGHPALHAAGAGLGLSSGPHWECRVGDEPWRPARAAADRIPSRLSEQFAPPRAAWGRLGPWILGLFLLVVAWVLLPHRSRPRKLERAVFEPSRFRWILLAAWGVMALNNFTRLHPLIGFDVQGHVDYVVFLLEHGSLPLADQGWQMFQAPLFYVLAAGPHAALSGMLPAREAVQYLRLIPLACGAMQVEVAYRLGRAVFRDSKAAQIVCICLAGLLPMNLYMSHYVGNEPLAALLAALVVLICVRWLADPEKTVRPRGAAVCGIVTGLAILGKVTHLLLIPLAGIVVATRRAGHGARPRRAIARNTAAFAACVALVAGWYFLRNWIELGRPMVGGWDPTRGFAWWQDPGYRTASDLLVWGESLRAPIATGSLSLWDTLFSTLWLDGFAGSMATPRTLPPWNYDFLLVGAWLGLVPTALCLVGAGAGWIRRRTPEGRAALFASSCLALYVGAIAWLYLGLPTYSTGKATYLLGLTPCIALLGALGFRTLGGNRLVRAILIGALACFFVAAWLGYFVVR